MGIGEVVGGVALLGVAVLIGLALIEDNSPETLTTSDATLVDPSATTAGATTTAVTGDSTADSATDATESTEKPAATEATEPVDVTTAPTSSAAPTSTTETPTTEPPTTEPPTTQVTAAPTTTAPPTTVAPPTTLSLEQKREVNVRVLNGGAPAGGASRLTAALRYAGFTAPSPDDTSNRVAQSTILYAPFQEGGAAAVNVLVGARPENVREGNASDPNWAAYGAGHDVLVVLGPGPG